MAWMFTNVAEPNLQTGLVSVPTTLTVVSTATGWLKLGAFSNTVGPDSVATIDLTNTAGKYLMRGIQCGYGQPVHIDFIFRKYVGLKWVASVSGVDGQLEAYE